MGCRKTQIAETGVRRGRDARQLCGGVLGVPKQRGCTWQAKAADDYRSAEDIPSPWPPLERFHINFFGEILPAENHRGSWEIFVNQGKEHVPSYEALIAWIIQLLHECHFAAAWVSQGPRQARRRVVPAAQEQDRICESPASPNPDADG